MRDAKRIVAELGGSWRYNNRAEIVFEHPLCDTHVISKGNRLETNDKLTTWIRNLARAREELRIAFGFDERRESA
jgi:hypothetical protein